MPFTEGNPLVLRNCEVVKPDIEDYMKHRVIGPGLRLKPDDPGAGNQAGKALWPAGRGRRFPTGLKWEHMLGSPGGKYVICNGDEETGAFMDRNLLEGDPTACWRE